MEFRFDRARIFVHSLSVEFEWDPNKATLNHSKHGIHFNEARALWDDPGRILLPSRFPDEPRYLAIGKIEQTCWTAIFTERGDVIRIISVRRARQNEQSIYEQNQS